MLRDQHLPRSWQILQERVWRVGRVKVSPLTCASLCTCGISFAKALQLQLPACGCTSLSVPKSLTLQVAGVEVGLVVWRVLFCQFKLQRLSERRHLLLRWELWTETRLGCGLGDRYHPPSNAVRLTSALAWARVQCRGALRKVIYHCSGGAAFFEWLWLKKVMRLLI